MNSGLAGQSAGQRHRGDFITGPRSLATIHYSSSDPIDDEFFIPRLANRQKRGAFRPDDDAMSRAKAFVASIRAAQPESRLPADVRRQIIEAFPEIRQGVMRRGD